MGSSKTAVAQPSQEVVTPAVAQTIARDADSARQNQLEARQRMRGIRGTYNRFASEQGGAGQASKLG